MQSLDLRVLQDVKGWHLAGHAVTLVTVVQTWGSAPRQPGAMLAVRGDGVVSGSVSGGCVEDDLIARTQAAMQHATAAPLAPPTVLTYGVGREEAARFGLPCGGTLRLVQETLGAADWVDTVLQRTAQHQLVARTLTLATGASVLSPGSRGQVLAFDGETLTTLYGPRWRLLLIGAGQIAQTVAMMAVALDFEVWVCDPREEYVQTFFANPLPGVRRLEGMPDDAVRALQADAHTAIVALTHDPKLDDMALLEALTGGAFYVGALGSLRNQSARKQRLAAHFGLTPVQLDRLHGPVGLPIGARAPAEIAVSIVAEIIQGKNLPQLAHAPAAAAA